ncbi:unnamed protein product, partial [Protopolystoma xenopodis]
PAPFSISGSVNRIPELSCPSPKFSPTNNIAHCQPSQIGIFDRVLSGSPRLNETISTATNTSYESSSLGPVCDLQSNGTETLYETPTSTNSSFPSDNRRMAVVMANLFHADHALCSPEYLVLSSDRLLRPLSHFQHTTPLLHSLEDDGERMQQTSPASMQEESARLLFGIDLANLPRATHLCLAVSYATLSSSIHHKRFNPFRVKPQLNTDFR